MIKSGVVRIGTGDDDLREGSQVWIRIYMRASTPFVQEVAEGMRFADRTDFTAAWTLRTPVPVEDIEKVEVSFVPNRRDFMEDDKWWFTKFTFAVNEPTRHPGITIRRELFRDDRVNRKFERADTWSTGILPTFDIVGDTLLNVRDESDVPVEGAVVFVDASMVGRTDRQGQLRISTQLFGNERIIARKLVHEQDYYRSNHNFDSTKNWNYRVHITNLAIDPTGTATPRVIRDGRSITLPIARSNTLVGLNILVAIEWDASAADVTSFRDILSNLSAFLYNATDGQFFIETAQLYDQARLWDDSDCRCLADLGYHANVSNITGGFLGWNVLGSAMNMSRADDAATYAHEFGHFGLDLGDEYRDDDSSVQCAGNLRDEMSPFRAGASRASCMMWRQWEAPKICSSHPLNRHVPGTRQGDQSCWDKLAGRYNHSDKWRILTPVDRGDIPDTIRFADGTKVDGPFLNTTFAISSADLPSLIGGYALTVTGDGGSPITGLVVKTQDQTGRWITQGATDTFGVIGLAGVHAGDRIRLEGGSGFAFERSLPGGTTSLVLVIP